MDYQKDSTADGEALGNWIKSAVTAGYRIDINRIYLTGFSRGGSGSYPLAWGMEDAGMYFAAIIRCAGQSKPDLGNSIAAKTAVWYHIGLNDTTQRVDIAAEALKDMREYSCNANAVETSLSDNVSGKERMTITLTRRGYPVFKYSEYTGMGHESGPCYDDEGLFKWLFTNSLAYR